MLQDFQKVALQLVTSDESFRNSYRYARVANVIMCHAKRRKLQPRARVCIIRQISAHARTSFARARISRNAFLALDISTTLQNADINL